MLPLVSSVDLCNRAIQLIGGFDNQAPLTGSLPTFDGSPTGVACGQLYNGAVQTVGRQYGWDFSRNLATLLKTGLTPPFGYAFEYVYPTNGIQLHQIVPVTTSDPYNPIIERWTVGNSLGPSVAAAGFIFFTTNPANGDTITLNGATFTFVTGTPTSYQFFIGGNAGGTIALAVQALLTNATYLADARLNVATYTDSGGSTTDSLIINYLTPGTAGNAYTLAASAATVSAGTLTGGATGQQRVIWTDLANAIGVISNQPPESAWDADFTESVVRLLASELALALDGKPETEEKLFGQFGSFAQVGQERTDT